MAFDLDDGKGGSAVNPRRRLVLSALACAALPATAQTLRPAQCLRTPEDGLGPFYRADQPAQVDLCIRPVAGPRIEVTGRVLGFPDCRPVPGATIEVWHADARGQYSRVSSGRDDDLACLLRGTLRTGEDGTYRFRTLDPGVYPGRPRHIHFRVSAGGHRPLVTQMYFEPAADVQPRLVAAVTPAAAGVPAVARFDLIIAPL